MGAVVLQSYTLADGTLCLKAFLSWSGSQTESVQAVYARPETDWPAQAKRIAEAWLSGVAAALAERMSHAGSGTLARGRGLSRFSRSALRESRGHVSTLDTAGLSRVET